MPTECNPELFAFAPVEGRPVVAADLIDHDELRHDPVLAALAGKLEAHQADCAPLAGSRR